LRRYTSLYFPIIVVLTMQVSCAIRSVYVPLSQNVPLFDSSKRLNSAAYLGTNHAEFQASYDPAKNLAIATNLYYGAGLANYDAAIGGFGYTRLGKWRYELFGGYGYNTNTIYGSGNFLSAAQHVAYDVNSVYHRLYLQPAIGFGGHIHMYKINYSFSFSTKLSYLYFEDYLFREKDLTNSSTGNPVYLIDKEYRNKGLYTIEPCITNKVGIGNLYGILQAQSISPYSDQIDVRNTKFSPVFYFSIGIEYHINFKQKHYKT
jgi:hypothetical protein